MFFFANEQNMVQQHILTILPLPTQHATHENIVFACDFLCVRVYLSEDHGFLCSVPAQLPK